MTSELTSYEKHYLLTNPDALLILMDMHDMHQDQADSMEAECYGDILRYEELRAHGATIIAADPGIWSDEILRRFAEPSGERLRRLTKARAEAATGGAQGIDGPRRDDRWADGSQKPNDAAAIPCAKAGSNTRTAEVLRELVAVKRLHDAIEAAEAKGTENFIGDKPLPFAQDEYEQRKTAAWAAAFALADGP